MSNRLDNTRVVVFDGDYTVGKKVIYKAGVKHYIHKDTVAKFEERKVKMKVSTFDEKTEVAKAKAALENQKKA